MAENQKQGGNMSVQEAGRLGGEKTAETHGSEFYQKIGKEGGEARKEQLGGSEGYSELGKMQGQENNPGNFANRDKSEVREAASKGGRN